MTRGQLTTGIVVLAAYMLSIPLANWTIEHLGTTCIPGGPCVVPVWPGIYCPTGSLMIGLSLVLRDVVQRLLGALSSVFAIMGGAALSLLVAPVDIAVASVSAFMFSEFMDFLVYTPLARRRFIVAVVASSMVGLVVDSILFLALAFHSLELLPGLVLGKTYIVLAILPVLYWVRRRFPVAA